MVVVPGGRGAGVSESIGGGSGIVTYCRGTKALGRMFSSGRGES